MDPTEGRIAKPERRWGCCHGTPNMLGKTYFLGTYVVIPIAQ